MNREVAEQVLHEKGLSRDDIHGVDRDTVTVGKRYDIAASLRRVCAACGRRRVAATVGSAFAFVGVTLALAGFAASASVVAMVAGFVGGWIYYRAPDVVFEAPDHEWELSKTESDGLSDRDVMLRLAIVRERNEYEKEIREQKRKEARNQSNKPTFRM